MLAANRELFRLARKVMITILYLLLRWADVVVLSIDRRSIADSCCSRSDRSKRAAIVMLTRMIFFQWRFRSKLLPIGNFSIQYVYK